jgi:hypothetical protein
MTLCRKSWPADAEFYSDLMPANLMTLAHFSVSRTISSPTSAGEFAKVV